MENDKLRAIRNIIKWTTEFMLDNKHEEMARGSSVPISSSKPTPPPVSCVILRIQDSVTRLLSQEQAFHHLSVQMDGNK